MITDTEIYRLEQIRDEINDLIDEVSATVADCDDYIIDGRAKKWITDMKENTINHRIIQMIVGDCQTLLHKKLKNKDLTQHLI